MPRTILVFSLLLASALCLAQVADYFEQVAIKAAIYTSALSESGWEFDGDSCFYGSLMSNGGELSISKYLTKGVTYDIWGFGDEDIDDLDLIITDSDGDIIAQDQGIQEYAECIFTAAYSDRYTIKVKNYRSSRNAFVFWGIMRTDQNAYVKSGEKCAQALQTAVNFFNILDESEETPAYKFFLDEICLVGGILYSETVSNFHNITVPNEQDCFFVGFGSDNVSDVDIKVCQQSSEGGISSEYSDNEYRLVGQDNSSSMVAVVYGYLDSDYYYALKYRNYKSDESGFIFTLMMTY